MDAIRLGLSLRALRIRRGWRQIDLSRRSGVSRGIISQIERGILTHATLDDIQRIAAALGAVVDVRTRWQGEALDRLLDEAHAATVAATAALLDRVGWQTQVEVSFSIWGERGSVDVLAWHVASATLVVIEVKSIVPDLQATLRDLDRKARLGPEIAAGVGLRPARTGRLLVVAESPTSRARIRRQAAVLDIALPARGAAVRAWLRDPSESIRGILFLSNAAHTRTKSPTWRRERVRAPNRRASSPTAAQDRSCARSTPPNRLAPR